LKIVLENNALRFIDCQGVRRWVFGCPLRQRELLSQNLIDLAEIVRTSTYKTVAALYDSDLEFQAIAHDSLALCKIDPDWLDIEMLQQFLLPHAGEDGAAPALLQTLNFPDVPHSGGKESTYEEAVAAVWSHTGKLTEALQAIGYGPDETLSWAELQAVLEARNAMADPEKAEEEEAITALEEDLKNPGNLGFNGARMATPDEAAAILAEI
jgi:hypothetical protein